MTVIASSRTAEYKAYRNKTYRRIRDILQRHWDPIRVYQKVWIPGDAPDDWDGEPTTGVSISGFPCPKSRSSWLSTVGTLFVRRLVPLAFLILVAPFNGGRFAPVGYRNGGSGSSSIVTSRDTPIV